MNEAEYSEIAEQTFTAIEEAIDDSGADIDYENAGGILTLTCEDTGSQVIVSRQVAMCQIWVAAKSGGFHCDYKGQAWVCSTTGESLQQLLSRVCTEQSDEAVELSW